MVAAGISSSSETQWDRSVGRGKRRDESFQAQAEKPLGTDSPRTISKRILAPDWAQKMLCIIAELHARASRARGRSPIAK